MSAPVPSYGRRGPSRVGLAVTLLLHLLLVGIFLLRSEHSEKRGQPPRRGQMVYVQPLQAKPKVAPQEQAPEQVVKADKPKPTPQPERVQVERLPNTITLPDEKPAPVARAEPQPEPAPEMDMSAAIEARRRARGAVPPREASPQESEDERATRIALANIASVNNRRSDDGNNGKGLGTFEIMNQTFNSAQIRVHLAHPLLRRPILRYFQVELGGEPDIETATINMFVALTQANMKDDFDFFSKRLGRTVTLSSRPKHTQQLRIFFFKEYYPDHSEAKG